MKRSVLSGNSEVFSQDVVWGGEGNCVCGAGMRPCVTALLYCNLCDHAMYVVDTLEAKIKMNNY